MITLKDIKEIAPTDNLYKFMAICGLAVAIVIWFTMRNLVQLSQDKADALQLQFIQLQTSHEIDKESLQSIKDQYADWKKELDLFPKLDEKTTPIPDLQKYLKAYQDMANRGKELVQKSDELDKQTIQHEGVLHEIAEKLKSSQREVDNENTLLGTVFKLIYVSLGFALLGFILWYLKLQRPMDKLLKKEFTEYSQKNITKG